MSNNSPQVNGLEAANAAEASRSYSINEEHAIAVRVTALQLAIGCADNDDFDEKIVTRAKIFEDFLRRSEVPFDPEVPHDEDSPTF